MIKRFFIAAILGLATVGVVGCSSKTSIPNDPAAAKFAIFGGPPPQSALAQIALDKEGQARANAAYLKQYGPGGPRQ